MKNHRNNDMKLLKTVLLPAVAIVLAAGITGSVTFASQIRERVARLETAFVQMHDDLAEIKKDIKTLLQDR